MFGYIRPKNGELLVRQAEYYRAAYCGLCRSMRKNCGFFTSFSLSYDFAFLTAVRTALGGELPVAKLRRCPAHPLKKRPTFEENPATKYCAAAAVLLSYRKLLDDIADEKGFKKLRARLVKPFFARGRKKALRHDPSLSELDGKIASLLSELSEVEKSDTPSADVPAEIFGKILGEILAFGLEGAEYKTAYRFGAAIGHWIYLVDAADDYAEDAEKGRYNPLIALYGGEMSDADRSGIGNALIAKLMDAEAAFDLMDMGNDTDAVGITKNILYLGLPNVGDEVLGGKCDKRDKWMCRGCGKR